MLLRRLFETAAEMAAKLDEWLVLYAALYALQVQAQALLDMVRRVAALLGYMPKTPREQRAYSARRGS